MLGMGGNARRRSAPGGGDHGKDQGRAGGATEAPIAPTSCASGLAAAAPSTYVERGYRGLWHGKGGNEDCDHLVLVVDPIVKPLTSLSLKASWSLKISLVTIYQAQISEQITSCCGMSVLKYYTLMQTVAPTSRSMY